MIVQFRNEKVSNHGSIPFTIDCNVVAFIVFEEGFHQPIKGTKHKLHRGTHIADTLEKDLKCLNLLKSLTATKWGATQDVSSTVYKTYIRPVLDYGGEVVTLASRTNLEKYDLVQNSDLRIIKGGAKSTLISAMQLQTDIELLDNRRDKFPLKFWEKARRGDCRIVLPAVRGLNGRGKNATNYDGEVSVVCEATMQLLSTGLAPAKFVFIDSQAAILALSIPSYVGIPDNERADQETKQGAELSQLEVLTHIGAKSIISTCIDKCTAMTQKTKNLGKPWGTSAGTYTKVPAES
ncbi:uncharacterized protein TNCV_4880801 [Trichonephila clavipes]|nr:uncharacterized protein TNCV_4880801 [Trichonephila clavipes]